jgi:hypothetical protein
MMSKYAPKIKVEPMKKLNKQTNDVYLGDQSVVDRLNSILERIKDGYYNEETKEKIYYQNEIFTLEDIDEEIRDVEQDLKYYVTGWFIHDFFTKNFGATETQD